MDSRNNESAGLLKAGSSEMVTFTGRYFDPLNPRARDVCIEDIAHHLSLLTRFNGACRVFYSVAEHSLSVAEHAPEDLKLHALLHDAAEAYIGDMVKPLKRKITAFSVIETGVLEAIAERFGIPFEPFDDPRLKELDLRALRREQLDITATPDDDWGLGHLEPLGSPLDPVLPPAVICRNFTSAFVRLTRS